MVRIGVSNVLLTVIELLFWVEELIEGDVGLLIRWFAIVLIEIFVFVFWLLVEFPKLEIVWVLLIITELLLLFYNVLFIFN